MEKGLRIRGLIETDLGFAGRVREIAGWNQLPADWRRFLALEPDGCFLAEVDGQAAGTATTTVYGSDLAWIGMVLVHPEFRRRGVGTALLGHAIHYLREIRRIPSVKLDATPEGLPLYEKLGFQAEWGLRRWLSKPGAHRTGGERELSSDPLSPMSAELDREVFGADRLAPAPIFEGWRPRSGVVGRWQFRPDARWRAGRLSGADHRAERGCGRGDREKADQLRPGRPADLLGHSGRSCVRSRRSRISWLRARAGADPDVAGRQCHAGRSVAHVGDRRSRPGLGFSVDFPPIAYRNPLATRPFSPRLRP